MSDEKLRKLIFDKYNVNYDGIDCIEMACIQPVINTIRQHDDAKTTRLIEEAINAMKDKLQQKQIELVDEVYQIMVENAPYYVKERRVKELKQRIKQEGE